MCLPQGLPVFCRLINLENLRQYPISRMAEIPPRVATHGRIRGSPLCAIKYIAYTNRLSTIMLKRLSQINGRGITAHVRFLPRSETISFDYLLRCIGRRRQILMRRTGVASRIKHPCCSNVWGKPCQYWGRS